MYNDIIKSHFYRSNHELSFGQQKIKITRVLYEILQIEVIFIAQNLKCSYYNVYSLWVEPNGAIQKAQFKAP